MLGTPCAVCDTFVRFNSKKDEADEVLARYGLDMKALHNQNKAGITDLIALPRAPRAPRASSTAGASAKAGPPTTGASAKAGPPTAGALVTTGAPGLVPWTRPLRAQYAPPPTAKAKATAKAHGVFPAMTDVQVQKLSKSSRRHGFLSHTHQFHHDALCVTTCALNNHPEWLRWPDGSYAPEEGSDTRL